MASTAIDSGTATTSAQAHAPAPSGERVATLSGAGARPPADGERMLRAAALAATISFASGVWLALYLTLREYWIHLGSWPL